MDRPPSCGQDENRVPPFWQKSTFDQGQRDNTQHSLDAFADFSAPQLMPMDDWDHANPYVSGEKLVSATVSRTTGEWTTKFQHRCDQLGVRPSFDHQEVSPYRFTASVRIGDRRLGLEVPQMSKKHAKEQVCKLALEQMPALEKMEGMDGQGKKDKKRRSGDSGNDGFPRRDDAENWIGILNTHCQRNHFPLPSYEDGRTAKDPPRFSAGVAIEDRPGQPFTSGTSTFSTKKDAKATAAKNAVLWLRSQGKLAETSEKRQRTLSSASEGGGAVPVTIDLDKTQKQQVHELCAALGFNQPRWIDSPSTGSSGEIVEGSFIDMAAYFDDRDAELEPKIQGPVGQVRHCFGKNKAKEACCGQVLLVLLEIKRSRLGFG